MATAAQSVPPGLRSLQWVRDFLREELAPYPGRYALVARMTLAASIVMVINMTFRIPYGAYGAVYALTISRENPDATLKAVKIILVSFSVAVADVLLGAIFFSGDPLLRLLWVAATFLIMFYSLSALSSYTAAARFGYLVVITIPLWDQQVPAETRVENTLWAVGAISMASVITAVVELLFHKLKPWDDLTVSIANRLEQVNALLGSYLAGAPDKSIVRKVQRFGVLGTSRMRRDIQRSGYSPQYAEKMAAVAIYVGRLVDIAANLTYLTARIPAQEHDRLRKLRDAIETVRSDLLNRRTPPQFTFHSEEDSVESTPLLHEMEVTVSLIGDVFAGTQPLDAFAPPTAPAESRKGLFVPDAFSNLDHLRFGLKGGLAALICYLTYNLIAWPGISTAVTTCLLTALTTVGSSRQKQVLRFSGALTGGAIALFAQVFILPSLDGISGFLVLFVAVTVFAAWFATAGPRLSYFGVQVATAFYLINLQEFKFQTSLAVARDRVVGILLGLFVMWLVFDQLWGRSAAAEMKRIFNSTIRLLAQLTREPVSSDLRRAIEKSFSLRETINANFDQVRQHGDGIMLEFGSSRERDLALRAQLLQWQYELRSFFIVRIALLKYRMRLIGFELPEPVRSAQKQFDDCLAAALDDMADRLEGKARKPREDLQPSFESLQKAVQEGSSAGTLEQVSARLGAFLELARQANSLVQSLDREIGSMDPALRFQSELDPSLEGNHAR
jgi:multidrug resistance protein MdtO